MQLSWGDQSSLSRRSACAQRPAVCICRQSDMLQRTEKIGCQQQLALPCTGSNTELACSHLVWLQGNGQSTATCSSGTQRATRRSSHMKTLSAGRAWVRMGNGGTDASMQCCTGVVLAALTRWLMTISTSSMVTTSWSAACMVQRSGVSSTFSIGWPSSYPRSSRRSDAMVHAMDRRQPQ